VPKVDFDLNNPDRNLVRHIVIRRLREDQSWRSLDLTGAGFLPYVNLPGPQIGQFAFFAQEVYWQLLSTGVIAPGYNQSNIELPDFHLTPFGAEFVRTGEWPAYDPASYLERLVQSVPTPDPTVLAYLAESLRSFERGGYVASAVMLGIAAERVFLLLCESTEIALGNPSEKQKFSKMLVRYPMKPKLDFLREKYIALQKTAPSGFPDNAVLMVMAVYDIMRTQRNDLGHPQKSPPSVEAADVLTTLQVFPRYYKTVEVIREVLKSAII
jgi:hypothetical protein